MAMHNSFILFSKSKKRKLRYPTYLQFKQSVIESLVLDMRVRKNIARTPQKPYRGEVSTSTSDAQGSTRSRSILCTPKSLRRSASSTTNRSTTLTKATNADCQLVYHTKTICSICEDQGIRKKTSYQCKTHSIAICILNCYDNHRKISYIIS